MADTHQHKDEPLPLGQHLEELRKAIIVPLFLVAFFMIGGIIWKDQVLNIIFYPVRKGVGEVIRHYPEAIPIKPTQQKLYPAMDGSLYAVRNYKILRIHPDSTKNWEFAVDGNVLRMAVSPDALRVAFSVKASESRVILLDARTGELLEFDLEKKESSSLMELRKALTGDKDSKKKVQSIYPISAVEELRFSENSQVLFVMRITGEVMTIGRDGRPGEEVLKQDEVSFDWVKFYNQDPMAVFLVIMKAAIIFALIPGIPFLVYSLWNFARPGLMPHEIKVLRPLLWFVNVLFFAGVAFAYFMVVPVIAMFLFTLNAAYAEVIWDISAVFNLTLLMSFAFGLIFQLPLVIILVSLLNIIHPNTLAKHRRVIWLACFILAAFLTPPDPVSQSLMAIPTVLLFELGVWLARVFLRKRLKAMEEEDRWDDDDDDHGHEPEDSEGTGSDDDGSTSSSPESDKEGIAQESATGDSPDKTRTNEDEDEEPKGGLN